MGLLVQLNDEMKQAMKSKEIDKLSVIRMLKTALENEAIKLNKQELTKEEELTVLSRELEQRKDSLHEYEKAGRDDLAEKIRTELKYIKIYMSKHQLIDK